jgi:hypothetical protein
MNEKTAVSDEMIRAKAYELWEQRGYPLGSPEVDWRNAKALLEQDASAADKSQKDHAAPQAISVRPKQREKPYGLREWSESEHEPDSSARHAAQNKPGRPGLKR